jgi:ANTAR domain/GAF domain
VTGHDDLLVRLARAVATTPPGSALSERLCLACCDLAGADAAALTMSYTDENRVTLYATDEVAARLEDLQDVMGQGPGRTAVTSQSIEVCALGDGASSRWPQFATAGSEQVGAATVHAVPMRPDGDVLGLMTLYQVEHHREPLALPPDTLLRLAAATASALLRDPDATSEEVEQGPWQSRARIHQATGMVAAQLSLAPDDAVAVLRAHAYAGDTTLSDVAARVLSREIRFHPPTEGGH